MNENPAISDWASRQNAPKMLQFLSAASVVYGRAKTLMAIQFILTVLAAPAVAALVSINENLAVWSAFYALTVSLLDVLVLERLQSAWRKKGARLQESFDCNLFDISWNTMLVGKPLDSEFVGETADKIKGRPEIIANLKDWYPRSAGDVSPPFQQLICQRANCWWDSKLRRRVADFLAVVLVAEVLLVFVIALVRGDTIGQMILTVYAPLAPAILWTVGQIFKQRDAAIALDELRGQIEDTWSNQLQIGSLKPKTGDSDIRRIQDCIYNGRCSNPLIFDWINSVVRPRNQLTMNEKATELAGEAKRMLSH